MYPFIRLAQLASRSSPVGPTDVRLPIGRTIRDPGTPNTTSCRTNLSQQFLEAFKREGERARATGGPTWTPRIAAAISPGTGRVRGAGICMVAVVWRLSGARPSISSTLDCSPVANIHSWSETSRPDRNTGRAE
jgi:hypothetical protein